VAFIELFELIVMFALTNSPAIVQVIINELLRNLINTEKVGSFIDNVIVEIESKKEYNKLVEEILRRL